MPKTYQIDAVVIQEIKKMMKKTKDKNIYRRLEAVALRFDGKSYQEISEITNYNASYVSKLVSKCYNQGIESLLNDNRRGGNHRNMSLEEEAELLMKFETIASSGQMITIHEIKKEYDKKLGRESSLSIIYCLLERHGWRKIMPRSKHPKKASDEEINSSKKLT